MSKRTELEKLRDAARAASLLEPGSRARREIGWSSICFLPYIFSWEPSGARLFVCIVVCALAGLGMIALWRNWRFAFQAWGLIYLVQAAWFIWTAMAFSPIMRPFRFFPELAIGLYAFGLAWYCFQAASVIQRAASELRAECITVSQWIGALETDAVTIPTNSFVLGKREFSLLPREAGWFVRETAIRRTTRWTVEYSVYGADAVTIDGGSPAYLVLGKRRIKGANAGTADTAKILRLHA